MFKGIRKYREILYTTALKAGYKRYKDRYRVYGIIYNWREDLFEKDIRYVGINISEKAFHVDKVTDLVNKMMLENKYKYKIVFEEGTQNLCTWIVKNEKYLSSVLHHLNSYGHRYKAYEHDRDITDIAYLLG